MKRQLPLTVAAATGIGIFVASAVIAADTAIERRDGNTDTAQSVDDDTDGTIIRNSKLDGKRMAHPAMHKIRASELKGMNIQNSRGEGVGEVSDVVLDANTGRIRYVAVTYGGLLGIGDKMFAVPFEAFKLRADADDAEDATDSDDVDRILILDVTEKQLDGHAGFDQEHWPNFADAKFTKDLDMRYGVERRMRPKDGKKNREGKLANAGRLDDKTTGANIRSSQLVGMDIVNSKGEDVGEVSDIVLDCRDGKIRYAAVTYGGFLGLGDKMFAVPFKAFKVRMDEEDKDEQDVEDIDYVLVLDVTQKQLEGDKGFDQDHWPDFADPKYTNEVDKRYGIDIRVGRRGVSVDVDTDEKTDQ